MNPKRLAWDFDHHAPDAEKVKLHEDVRVRCHDLARALNACIPDCREKSLAVTNIEQAMFWANAALARNPRPDEVRSE